MKLNEWLEKTGTQSQNHVRGCVQVFVTIAPKELYELDDYRIWSSASGPSYILCPKDQK